jgi:ketosteroid isomerase-like protein
VIGAERQLPLGGALMVLCALALVAVIAALVIEGRPAGSTSTLVFPTVTAAPTEVPAPAASEVSAEEADAVLAAYSDAYAAEDPFALAGLMTADVVRATEGEREVRGADAVAAAYAEQFDLIESPSYTFTATEFTPSADDALVSGTYTIESASAGPATGGIAFYMVRVDGQLLIGRIDIVPIE